MITFIPSWKEISSGGLVTDDLVGQVRAVMGSDEGYLILISDYIPNLSYFLHRYDLLESNYKSIFDQLQDFEELEQKRITIDDLMFPKNIDTFYTPSGLYVYQDTQKIGELIFGEGGQIHEVKYFKNSVLDSIDIYDDRGVISSRKVFDEAGNVKYTEYLDLLKNWIFREFQESGKCTVNLENHHGLRERLYGDIEELKFELINNNIEKLDDSNKIILALTDYNIEKISNSDFLSKVTLSFFGERYTYLDKNRFALESILKRTNSVIVESEANLNRIKKYTDRKIHKLSPFDTRFTLSVSQELKEEVIYFETRGLRDDMILTYFNTLLTYLFWAPDPEHGKRYFKIILRTDWLDAMRLEELISKIISQRFPKESEEINQQIAFTKMENTIDGEGIELSAEAWRIKNISEGIEVLNLDSEELLFKSVNQSRIIIDLSNEPDLLTQIAGISAGIPQINKVETEYVTHDQNGLIVRDEKTLYEAILYYLENLSHWQTARVNAVKQIRKYSGEKLFYKISKILAEGQH